MNSASIVKRFGQKYLVKRNCKEGQYVEGHWTPTNRIEEFYITASVQPIKGEELQRLPEAQRTRQVQKLYTTTKLQTTIEAEQKNADIVVIDDEKWEVSNVSKWTGVLNHFECVILKMNSNCS